MTAKRWVVEGMAMWDGLESGSCLCLGTLVLGQRLTCQDMGQATRREELEKNRGLFMTGFQALDRSETLEVWRRYRHIFVSYGIKIL